MNVNEVDAGLEQKVFHGGGLRRSLEGKSAREIQREIEREIEG